MQQYRDYACEHYRKHGRQTTEVTALESVLRVLEKTHRRTFAADFGPKALKGVRDKMVALEWKRISINKQVGRIRRMFKWAASEELIDVAAYQALTGRLPKNRSICYERLTNGFLDGKGTFMTGRIHRKGWFSDCHLDFGRGAKGDTPMTLEIPNDLLPEYERIEEGKPDREFLIPAEIVNRLGKPEVCDEDKLDW